MEVLNQVITTVFAGSGIIVGILIIGIICLYLMRKFEETHRE